MNILDKEEFRVKLGQINKLVETQDYKGAMQIVDSIDWRRVKNVRTLCVVGEIYAANKRYEESKEIFLLAYHRAPIGKNILYRLIEVSLKMGQISEATEFFDEYREVAVSYTHLVAFPALSITRRTRVMEWSVINCCRISVYPFTASRLSTTPVKMFFTLPT